VRRYLKYLTKKFLKKYNVRDWLRVIASHKDHKCAAASAGDHGSCFRYRVIQSLALHACMHKCLVACFPAACIWLADRVRYYQRGFRFKGRRRITNSREPCADRVLRVLRCSVYELRYFNIESQEGEDGEAEDDEEDEDDE
jgi:Ribosomal L22e protein family